MDGMATSVLDRVVRWNLDFDGDIYGYGEGSSTWWGAAAGAVFGAGISAVAPFVRSRRRPQATPAAQDED
jgi:hypothetical protein